MIDFSEAGNTFIVSDIHLTTAEPINPTDPLWKKFKQRTFFIDDAFEVFLEKIQEKAHEKSPNAPIELIMAGDIFDFDGVTQLPQGKRFFTTWLERRRGLNTEERKSIFKMKMIIQDHPVFFRALRNFVEKGNRLVFIIGNHDLELHWPGVQSSILRAMKLKPEDRQHVIFNTWFYISNKDTLIEHGNQHDSHSNCQNPINPKIKGLHKDRIRLPFSSHANRYMLNGMGYFNPHSDRTYIMNFVEYIEFAIKHLIRREPFIMWTWFWGACATLLLTLRDGILPEVKDPLKVEEQVEEIAKMANATPRMVRELKEIHSPPSFSDPLGISRELWLDRVFLIVTGFLFGYTILNLINFVWKVSYWWIFVIFLFFVPFFTFYFRSFKSKVIVPVKFYERAVKLGSRIAGVKRVVYGHTHQFVHTNFDGIEYLNSGTWSPAFDDIECRKPSCPKTFVWIRPEQDQPGRVANVFEWKDNDLKLLC